MLVTGDMSAKRNSFFLVGYSRSLAFSLMWLVVVAVAAAWICGCHSTSSKGAESPLFPTTPAQPIPQPSETAEQIAFREMSAFYCEHKRWPQSWSEFAKGHNEVAWVKEFQQAELSTPRAIVSMVRYRDAKGAAKNVAFIAPPRCAPELTPTDPRQVSIAGGRVSFMVPHGFAVLKSSDIQTRWGRAPFPDVAWEDSVSRVVVALRFADLDLAPTDLEQLKPELEAAYEESVPGIVWISRAFRSDDGPQRLVHHFESESSRGKLNTMAFTFSFDSKLLTLSIVGPAEQRAAVQQVAVAVRSTLRLQ